MELSFPYTVDTLNRGDAEAQRSREGFASLRLCGKINES